MFWNALYTVAGIFMMSAWAAAAGEPLTLWSVDPLVKVFQDAAPAGNTTAESHAARGEHATFQVVARAEENLDAVSASVSLFTNSLSTATLPDAAVRFMGYVHVDRPTQKPSSDQLRTPPADYPDVLLEEQEITLSAHKAQPVWVTVAVPKEVPEGIYTAVLTVKATSKGEVFSCDFPLKLTVYPVVVDKTRLWVTNWFSMNWKHMKINPEPESDGYYALLRRFARNMAEHRQNVALISPLSLAEFGVDAAGELTINFDRFDRWVRIFQEEGVLGLIEGGHIGGRSGGWESEFVASIRVVRDGAVVSERVPPGDEKARAFYSRFFPALVAHLREQGLLEHYTQHLADEPIVGNLESYRALAALARDYAPELRIIEANHSKELVGAMDVWVPQLNFLHNDFEHYRARQEAGDEVWFYTCVFPQGEYANRFIEQPLIKTRLLHWINFLYGITGYLHWGYNHWTDDDPITHTTRPHGGPPYLPAGDPWVVYPGTDGPLDSIRFEAMRDGVVDHELLCMLAEADSEAARTLAATHILDFDRYNTDVEQFRATRIALLQALSALHHP